MANTMNRTTIVMYRALHNRHPLLYIPFADNGQNTRKRRILYMFPFSRSGASNQMRLFRSTLLSILPYPSSSTSPSLLPAPTIIYSDNHILAVNKPPGWHSVPNIPKQRKKTGSKHRTDSEDKSTNTMSGKKCLLTLLQQRGLGGGSKNDFLVPLHRIDQPCTGILLFGKTSKAASRVTKVWKGKRIKKKCNNKQDVQQANTAGSIQLMTRRGVIKDYLCVVPRSRLGAMEKASVSVNDATDKNIHEIDHDEFSSSVRNSLAERTEWKQLDGLMLRQSANGQHESSRQHWQRKEQQRYYKDRLQKGRSVKIIRTSKIDDFYDYNHNTDNALMRPVHAMWKVLQVPTIEPSYTLLLVRTSEGARHMVRALLAQVGECPILGDVRYWKPKRSSSSNNPDKENENHDDKGPLKDRSVALHAYGVYFDQKQLKLGSLETFKFQAPVPPTWESFFGINNKQLQDVL